MGLTPLCMVAHRGGAAVRSMSRLHLAAKQQQLEGSSSQQISIHSHTCWRLEVCSMMPNSLARSPKSSGPQSISQSVQPVGIARRGGDGCARQWVPAAEARRAGGTRAQNQKYSDAHKKGGTGSLKMTQINFVSRNQRRNTANSCQHLNFGLSWLGQGQSVEAKHCYLVIEIFFALRRDCTVTAQYH